MIIQSTAQVWKQFEFWCEGVIFSSLGLFGLVSNLASIITFLSPEVFAFVFDKCICVCVCLVLKGFSIKQFTLLLTSPPPHHLPLTRGMMDLPEKVYNL